jgi:hypothetical protein
MRSPRYLKLSFNLLCLDTFEYISDMTVLAGQEVLNCLVIVSWIGLC